MRESKLEPIIKMKLLRCKDCNFNKKCLKLVDILMNDQEATDYFIDIMHPYEEGFEDNFDQGKADRREMDEALSKGDEHY